MERRTGTRSLVETTMPSLISARTTCRQPWGAQGLSRSWRATDPLLMWMHKAFFNLSRVRESKRIDRERAQQMYLVAVFLVDAEEDVQQVVLRLRRLAHHAKVIENEVAGARDRDVARVRVCVQRRPPHSAADVAMGYTRMSQR